MKLTGKNYRYCLKLKKSILNKCGKEPNDLVTIKDFCRVYKMKVKELLAILNDASGSDRASLSGK